MAQQPQTEPQPQPNLQVPFSLTPAIFTAFSALPKEPQPTAPEEKIIRILQNLDAQHKAVKRNMVASLQARKRELVRMAEEEIARLEGNVGVDDERDRVRSEQRKSMRQMVKSVRVKAKQGLTAEEYEVKSAKPDFKEEIPGLGAGTEDVEMSLMEIRSVTTIRRELSLALRDLVDLGTAELDAYDIHAAESTAFYKQALKRREERRGSTNTASVQSPHSVGSGGGFSRNSLEQSPADIRRLSTGTPISGAPVQPLRTFETVQEFARRGSMGK